jgi:ferredoxin
MKAVVDTDRCRGHAACWAVCPEVFTLTDDGYAAVLTPEVPPEFEEAVQIAVDGCPEQAITAE